MPLDATIAATYPLSARVRQLLLRVEDHSFDHRPGQHVSVRYQQGDERPIYRPYSPVNGPGTDTLILAVKRYKEGTCSVWLHERSVGDSITITPPSGNLHLQDLDRDVAFLATGTGLTPMLAMLGQYLEDGSGRAVLVFGERTSADLMYRATLDRLAASTPSLSVEYVLSKPSAEWNGPSGYVQEHLQKPLAHLDQPHVYVCGVPQMVVETESALIDQGVPSDDIFTEGWEAGAVED